MVVLQQCGGPRAQPTGCRYNCDRAQPEVSLCQQNAGCTLVQWVIKHLRSAVNLWLLCLLLCWDRSVYWRSLAA
jgi:hypothetical protein